MTAMTGKGAEEEREKFSEILINAVKIVSEGGKVDTEDIKIEKVVGEGIKDTELVKGIIIGKEKISNDMPKNILNAKILLIDFPLEIKSPEIETKISISSHSELQNFLDEEEKSIKNMIQKIVLFARRELMTLQNTFFQNQKFMHAGELQSQIWIKFQRQRAEELFQT